MTSSPLSTRVDNEKRVAVCACSRLASSGLDRLGLPPAGGCQERRSGHWPFHSARSREGSSECLGGDIGGQRSVANAQADGVDKSQARSKIGDIVHDAKTAALLSRQHVIGCKRIVVDTNYFETFNRDNVLLVDASTAPISAITAAGVEAGQTMHEIDTLVFATGFDARTGTALRMDLQGRNGQRIQDSWAAGPAPISGPGSPWVLTNMVASIEQHVEWIADCMFI